LSVKDSWRAIIPEGEDLKWACNESFVGDEDGIISGKVICKIH